MRKLALCLQSVNEYAYKIFSLGHGHQYDIFFDFGLSFCILKHQKGIFSCVCFIFCVLQRIQKTKELPGWPPDFRPEVTGFILCLGFSSCFSKFELPGFVLVPVLEQLRTSWFCSSSWNPTFVCSPRYNHQTEQTQISDSNNMVTLHLIIFCACKPKAYVHMIKFTVAVCDASCQFNTRL